eukprot:NODE_771_length_1795_cov_59.531501_g629_i0.p1 GENE.NODE_771_length_1795_cov_59.531501_g629_i0~~NODE_771_length_1795_cov_59.531501_g629_i0.p1  ORF type:complete len:459 (-),score=76.48 NODE_771_length_1795_cov_59.531501_g629_i0:269-1645(-)
MAEGPLGSEAGGGWHNVGPSGQGGFDDLSTQPRGTGFGPRAGGGGGGGGSARYQIQEAPPPLSPPVDSITCYHCGGAKKDPHRRWFSTKCRTCNGTGRVQSATIFPESQRCNLAVMNLPFYNLGIAGARWVSSLLPSCQALADLNLWGNDLQDEGVSLLMDGLRACPGLRILNLGENGITADGAYCIANNLQYLPSLVRMFLNRNFISEPAARHLIALIPQQRALLELFLLQNDFSPYFFATFRDISLTPTPGMIVAVQFGCDTHAIIGLDNPHHFDNFVGNFDWTTIIDLKQNHDPIPVSLSEECCQTCQRGGEFNCHGETCIPHLFPMFTALFLRGHRNAQNNEVHIVLEEPQSWLAPCNSQVLHYKRSKLKGDRELRLCCDYAPGRCECARYGKAVPYKNPPKKVSDEPANQGGPAQPVHPEPQSTNGDQYRGYNQSSHPQVQPQYQGMPPQDDV